MNETHVVLDTAPLVAFVPSTDLDRSHAFYGHTLGLQRVDSNPFAFVYDGGGTELRVTRVEEVTGAPYTVLGWVVDDIDDTVRALVAKGVMFRRFDGMDQTQLGVWTAPGGAQVAWFADPDGNVLSVTQRPG